MNDNRLCDPIGSLLPSDETGSVAKTSGQAPSVTTNPIALSAPMRDRDGNDPGTTGPGSDFSTGTSPAEASDAAGAGVTDPGGGKRKRSEGPSLHLSVNSAMRSVAVKRCAPGANGRSKAVTVGSIRLRPTMPSELPEHIRARLSTAEVEKAHQLLSKVRAKVEARIRDEALEAMVSAIAACQSSTPARADLSKQDVANLGQVATLLRQATADIESLLSPVTTDTSPTRATAGATPSPIEVKSDSQQR